MEFDLIIIWGGASGLFCAINSPKKYKKLILEKQNQLWTKILLSGWGRCNFSNTNISPDKYFWQNKKTLPSIFHKFNNHDFINFLTENWIKYKEENNERLILESEKSKDLLEFLIKKAKENKTKIQTNQNVVNVKKTDEVFFIQTKDEVCKCKKLVIASWWVSFPKTWTTGFGIDLAKKLWIKTIKTFPALCGIETKNWFSNLSGSSVLWKIKVFDKNKLFYETIWNILFTHWGLSWPAIFNVSAAIWEHLAKTAWNIKEIYIKLSLEKAQITKKLQKSNILNLNNETTIELTSFRSLDEAKVSSGGVSLDEINNNFESKKIKNLYFIGETLDIIWESGWFNLQRARSSGFVCWKNL